MQSWDEGALLIRRGKLAELLDRWHLDDSIGCRRGARCG